MRKIISNTLQLGLIVIWALTCYSICRSEEGFNYFLFWILNGFPFGFQKLRMLLFARGLGLAGEIGVFALDAIVAGLIGGIFLIKKLVVIMADYIRTVGKLFRRKATE